MPCICTRSGLTSFRRQCHHPRQTVLRPWILTCSIQQGYSVRRASGYRAARWSRFRLSDATRMTATPTGSTRNCTKGLESMFLFVTPVFFPRPLALRWRLTTFICFVRVSEKPQVSIPPSHAHRMSFHASRNSKKMQRFRVLPVFGLPSCHAHLITCNIPLEYTLIREYGIESRRMLDIRFFFRIVCVWFCVFVGHLPRTVDVVEEFN